VKRAAVALAGLTLASCDWFSRTAPPPPPRGLVLVLAAGLEPGLAGARNLERLARQGRAFSQAFAASPEPEEARAAVLGSAVSDLATPFRGAGFRVAGWSEPGATVPAAGAVDVLLRETGRGAPSGANDALTAWLRDQKGRFLVVASIGSPAGPPAVPAREPEKRAPALPRIAAADLAFGDRPGALLEPAAWSAPARERAAAAVLGRSLSADASLGRLLGAVERGAPGAALIVVGDPPADRGSHGVVDRPGLFDDTLRSTLVFSVPGLSRPGRASLAPVSTRDVRPTLLALAGLGGETGSGHSLLPQLADPGAASTDEVVSSAERRAGRVGRSARSARWRFTEWPDGSRELYDHDADPSEITNLASRPDAQAIVAELARAFDAPAASIAATPRADGPREPASRPNVLLVVMDDLNTRVGAWGAPVRTPNIDRLAARGVRFERAYVAVAMCSPSRMSLLTGWRPERTGVWNNLDPPRPEGARPLQEHFAANGYATAAIGKIYHFPERFRWDVQEEHPLVVEDEREGAPAPGDEGLWSAAAGGDLDQPDGRRALRAVRLLEGYRRRPFFLAVGFVRPHLRWIAPARYFGFYPSEAVTLSAYPADDLADVPAIAIKTRPQPLPGLPLLGREPPGLVRDPDFRRRAIAAYEACTTFVDAQLGMLLAALDRLDLWRTTTVVLIGDNGFHLGEHDGLLRKDTLFEEGLHVPLIVVPPGRTRGAVASAPVEISDLYPTLVELSGLPAVDGLDARSLGPLIENPLGPGRGPALSYRRVQPPERGYSIRTARWRYTLWPDGSEELYRSGREPEGSENLAAQEERSPDKHALRARLTALVAPRR